MSIKREEKCSLSALQMSNSVRGKMYVKCSKLGVELTLPTLILQSLISKRGKKGDPFNLSNYCQDANLVIAPKRGTAIMWYNHFLDSDDEWLGERDPYSLHGGCDVIRGTKWIANHWIPAPYKENRHLPSIYRRKSL